MRNPTQGNPKTLSVRTQAKSKNHKIHKEHVREKLRNKNKRNTRTDVGRGLGISERELGKNEDNTDIKQRATCKQKQTSEITGQIMIRQMNRPTGQEAAVKRKALLYTRAIKGDNGNQV